jgi:predicted phosphate transport protein (TIGR00153 family)
VGLFRRATDTQVLDLFEEAGRNVERASVLLRDVLTDYPERADLARDLYLCEQEGDRITHDVIHRLSVRNGLKSPMEASDGHALATAVDDIVDYAEQTADWLGLHAVEAPMEQSVQLAQVLVSACEHVARALRGMRTGTDFAIDLVEINRLENEGDRLHRDAVASLFANGIDPMVVIRWKDIFESLESAVDACEKVAHILEGILLKRRR